MTPFLYFSYLTFATRSVHRGSWLRFWNREWYWLQSVLTRGHHHGIQKAVHICDLNRRRCLDSMSGGTGSSTRHECSPANLFSLIYVGELFSELNVGLTFGKWRFRDSRKGRRTMTGRDLSRRPSTTRITISIMCLSN